MMIAITSFFGVIAFIGLKSIDMGFAVFLGIGTILGAHYGAKLAMTTHSDIIKKIISCILVLVALKLIVDIV